MYSTEEITNNIVNATLHVYESHMGGLYMSQKIISKADLQCIKCGKSDRYIGAIKRNMPIEEAFKMLDNRYGICLCEWAGCKRVFHRAEKCKNCPLTNCSNGHGKDVVMDFFSRLFSEEEVEAFFEKLIKEKQSKAKEQSEKHLYIDMDGVIALWDDYYKYALEDMSATGFFWNLEPNISLIKAVRILTTQYKDIDIHILSAVMNENSKIEKNAWLDKYLPEITADKRHFIHYGNNKADVFYGKDPKNYILLDDYTKNLRQWAEAGGKGICLLNGENSPSGKWRGDYVYYKTNPEILARTLHALVMA